MTRLHSAGADSFLRRHCSGHSSDDRSTHCSAGRRRYLDDCWEQNRSSDSDSCLPKEAGCRCAAGCDRIAADSAGCWGDRSFACAASSADGPRCDSDSATDSGAAADSHSDSAREDDFRRRSPLVAPTVDAAEMVDVAVATVGAAADHSAKTQLQHTVRNTAL